MQLSSHSICPIVQLLPVSEKTEQMMALSQQLSSVLATARFQENITTIPTGQDNATLKSSSVELAETIMIGFKIVVGIAGILGNTMVCTVLNRIRSEKVNFLIRSQAIIDLVISVFFVAYAFGRDLYPIPGSKYQIRGYLHCLLWKFANVKFWLFSISTYNLIVISIDRYVSIVHPMWYLVNFTRNKTIILACCVWLLGPIFQFIFSVTQTFFINGQCTWDAYQPVGRIIMGVWLFTWDFFMPCMIMAYCSTRICLIVIANYKHDKKLKAQLVGRDSSSSNSIADADYRKNLGITVTFIVVVVAYVICWSLDQFLFLHRNITGVRAKRSVTLFSHVMAQLNCAVCVLHERIQGKSEINFLQNLEWRCVCDDWGYKWSRHSS